VHSKASITSNSDAVYIVMKIIVAFRSEEAGNEKDDGAGFLGGGVG
jgi:hypothetical protein